jgi:hypothetical protein
LTSSVDANDAVKRLSVVDVGMSHGTQLAIAVSAGGLSFTVRAMSDNLPQKLIIGFLL